MTQTFTIDSPGARADYVHEFTQYHESNAFNQPTEWLEGLKYFVRDSDQATLNKTGEKQFQVVATGEIIDVR